MSDGRNRAASLAASPTMVGAITTLVVIVTVFLAYNANNGLPFVPTYQVSVNLCNASRLSPNNEVRIGGNRVGVVQSIETVDIGSAADPNDPTDVTDASGCQTASGDSSTAAAKLNLKLDESASPLPEDSTVRVRYRSSFGLKYLEITRGEGRADRRGRHPVDRAGHRAGRVRRHRQHLRHARPASTAARTSRASATRSQPEAPA